jgi:hypothetical protein
VFGLPVASLCCPQSHPFLFNHSSWQARSSYLGPPQGPQRKETQENIETVLHTGTGDYVLKSPGGSRRVYRAKNVRKGRMDGNVEFVDQT